MTDSRLVNKARGTFPKDGTLMENRVNARKRETIASDWKAIPHGRPVHSKKDNDYWEDFSKSCAGKLRHADNHTGRAIIRYSDASADLTEFMQKLAPALRRKKLHVPQSWEDLEFALSHLKRCSLRSYVV